MTDCESIKNFNNIVCDEYSCRNSDNFTMDRDTFNKCLKRNSESINNRHRRKSPKRETWFHRRSPKRR